MAKRGEDMNEESKNGSSKDEDMRWAGIGPELVEFVMGFSKNPISSLQCLPKDAAQLKIRWTQFYLRLSRNTAYAKKRRSRRQLNGRWISKRRDEKQNE